MLKLYYKQGACSMAPHVVLHELGLKKDSDFALIEGVTKQGATAEFKQVNPRGMVPVLVTEEGQVIREGAAVLTYLCEHYRSDLLPASGPERVKVQEWLAFANATLHPKFSVYFGAAKKLGKEAASDPVVKSALEGIQKCWDDVEQQLAQQDYIATGTLSVADILLTVIGNWAQHLPVTINYGPKTKAYLKRVSDRPSYQEALEHEHVQYKAAA